MAKRGAPVGNTNAAKDNRMITSALRRAVTQNPDKLQKACMKVLDDAVEGNLPALTFIADRLDGKPAQAVTVGNEDGEPFKVYNLVELVALGNGTDSDT